MTGIAAVALHQSGYNPHALRSELAETADVTSPAALVVRARAGSQPIHDGPGVDTMKISLSEKLDRIVRQKAREVSSYLSTGSTDIESLAILVMMEATKDADEDIRLLLEEVRSVCAAKRQLRQIVCQVGKDISDNLGGRGRKRRLTFSNGMTSESAYHRVPLPIPDCSCAGGVRLISTNLHKGPIGDVAQLEAIRDDLQAKLDGMNEMSEMTSLRLQMMMDRRSKFVSTLSNIMKKISDTHSAVVQNLK